MSSAYCNICFGYFPLDKSRSDFRIYPCGHGWCSKCDSSIHKERRPKCPHCRCTLHRAESHPIFVEIVSAEKAAHLSFIDGLSKITPDTPSGSITRACTKLQQIAQGPKIEENEMSAILQAIDDFRTRIIPLYENAESIKKELQIARSDKESLSNELAKMRPLPEEVRRLRASLGDSKKKELKALELAESAKVKIETERNAVLKWQEYASGHEQKIEEHKQKIKENEQEIKKLKDSLERQLFSARVQKENIRKLVGENSLLKEKAQSQAVSDPTVGYSNTQRFSGNKHKRKDDSMPSSPRALIDSFDDENVPPVDLDFQGMPPPNFRSDWQLAGDNRVSKKRQLNRSTFPIELDGKGRPTKAVQLGPKSTIYTSYR